MSTNHYSVDSGGRRISSVLVGKSSPNLHGWVRSDVYFHRFEDLCPKVRSQCIASPSFSCLGRDWAVKIEGTGPGTIYIKLQSSNYENVDAGISIHDGLRCWKPDDFYLGVSAVTGYLVDGDLWIEVSMRMTNCAFFPEPSACQTLRELFMEKESADVVFDIKGDQKTSPKMKFYAHRLILRKASPQLAELCVMDGSPSHVEIPDISPATFELLLRYIYGHTVTNFGEDISHVKEIIEAADKFEVTNLKLDAEAWYVSKTTFTTENVHEHLQYAESKNCALLKEACVGFIVDFCSVNGTLLANAAVEVSATLERRGRNRGELWSLSICDLRRKSHDAGLHIDGSRAMLISALESDAKSE